MKLTELLEGIPCRVEGNSDRTVSDLIYDTRKPMDSDTLFVCITGFKTDGHSFAEEVYAKGVRMFAAEKELHLPADATVVYAEDTRRFLALASSSLFGHPTKELFTVAITGTKGKTSTSFFLQSILEAAGIPCGVIGSTGIYYGDVFEETFNTTPESYLLHQTYRRMADAGMKAVVIEAASQGFKLHRTYGISFDAGIFTNLSPDHIGENEHKDFDEYQQCKKMIFKQSKVVYVNADDPHFDAIVAGESNAIPYALESKADFTAANPVFTMKNHRMHTTFTANCPEGSFPVELNVPGYFSVYNAMAAIAAAKGLRISDEAIRKGLSNVTIRGRMERVPLDKPFTVLIDAAHEPFSTRSLLETVRMYQPGRIISLFGCGGNRSPLRRPGMGKAVGELSDYAILTADNSRMEKTEDIIKDILEGFAPTGCPYEIETDRETAIKKALAMAKEGDVILLLGKGHENYVDIGGRRTPFNERQIVLDYFAHQDTL